MSDAEEEFAEMERWEHYTNRHAMMSFLEGDAQAMGMQPYAHPEEEPYQEFPRGMAEIDRRRDEWNWAEEKVVEYQDEQEQQYHNEMDDRDNW